MLSKLVEFVDMVDIMLEDSTVITASGMPSSAFRQRSAFSFVFMERSLLRYAVTVEPPPL